MKEVFVGTIASLRGKEEPAEQTSASLRNVQTDRLDLDPMHAKVKATAAMIDTFRMNASARSLLH